MIGHTFSLQHFVRTLRYRWLKISRKKRNAALFDGVVPELSDTLMRMLHAYVVHTPEELRSLHSRLGLDASIGVLMKTFVRRQ